MRLRCAAASWTAENPWHRSSSLPITSVMWDSIIGRPLGIGVLILVSHHYCGTSSGETTWAGASLSLFVAAGLSSARRLRVVTHADHVHCPVRSLSPTA